ncbi:MAG: DUF3311 domain-containing protein [Desulfovibrio sp.]|jgi:hypothetical protein|nr:DUF3311 domain-containing protein [Desulfovibrio sp.]
MQSRLPTFLLVVGVPFTLLVLCFKIYNRIEPMILGFPFLYFWLFSCLFISFASMYVGWRIDPKSDRNLRKQNVKNNAQNQADSRGRDQ